MSILSADNWSAVFQRPGYPESRRPVVMWKMAEDGYVFGLVVGSDGRLTSAEHRLFKRYEYAEAVAS